MISPCVIAFVITLFSVGYYHLATLERRHISKPYRIAPGPMEEDKRLNRLSLIVLLIAATALWVAIIFIIRTIYFV